MQRVRKASVNIDGATVGAIGEGMMALVAAGKNDRDRDVDYLVRKLATLRIFDDSDGLMNLSVEDTGGEVLVVSQFTLYGDCRKGRRPSFVSAMAPECAEPMVEQLVEGLRKRGLRVATGRFGAAMDVTLVNHGPITLLIDSNKSF